MFSQCTGIYRLCRKPELGLSEKMNNYMGDLNVTEGGLTCQRWDTHFPHFHRQHNPAFPEKNKTLAKNYCRNSDNDWSAWCITTNPDVKWQYCDLPKCGKLQYNPIKCNAMGHNEMQYNDLWC